MEIVIEKLKTDLDNAKSEQEIRTILEDLIDNTEIETLRKTLPIIEKYRDILIKIGKSEE